MIPCDVPCIPSIGFLRLFNTEQVGPQQIGRSSNKTEHHFNMSKDNKKKCYSWNDQNLGL